MSVAQDVLNRMELLNQELQLQPGEQDFARGLLAIDVAQKHFESLLALHPDVMGSQTGTLTQAQGVETTAFPAGVLRVDKLQYLDPVTNLPAWDLINLKRTGSHAVSHFWPWNITTLVAPGRPVGYYTNGTQIFWSPPADANNLIRWYGFQRAAAMTLTSSPFPYDDICLLPFASFAVALMRTGVDDNNDNINDIAQQTFLPVITALAGFNRDEATNFNYKYVHTE